MSVVLRYVNKARRACGEESLTEIERGQARDPRICPLANSLPSGIKVHADLIKTGSEAKAKAIAKAWRRHASRASKRAWEVPMPKVLQVFVEGVDSVDGLV